MTINLPASFKAQLAALEELVSHPSLEIIKAIERKAVLNKYFSVEYT